MDAKTLIAEKDGILEFAKTQSFAATKLTFVEEFLNSLRDDDFAIPGENVKEWFGYATQHKFKATFVKLLEPDVDYKMHATKNRKDVIYFSLTGYQKFEYLIRKRGDHFEAKMASYYSDFETLVKDYHKHMMETTGDDKYKDLIDKVLADMQTASSKRCTQMELDGCVYVYQDAQGNLKIGETTTLSSRLNQHSCSCVNGKLVYYKRSYNRKLLEKSVHHVLRQYRINDNREWFKVPTDVAIETIDMLQMVLDGFVGKCDYLPLVKPTIDIKNHIDTVNNMMVSDKSNGSGADTGIAKTTEAMQNMDIDADDMSDAEDDTSETSDIEVEEVKDAYNFEKFLKETCEMDPSYQVISAELFGAHRIWSKTTKKDAKDEFYKYMSDNFKAVKIFNEELKSSLTGYKGLRLKPFVVEKDDPVSEFDRFIDDCCNVGYSKRATIKNIVEAYEKWKQEKVSADFLMSPIEKRRLDLELQKRFVIGHVHIEGVSYYGCFGIEIKGKETLTGLKLAPSLKKPVAKVDLTTKKVVQVFDSLTEAAQHVGKGARYLSSDIKFKKPYGQYLYVYLPKKNPKGRGKTDAAKTAETTISNM